MYRKSLHQGTASTADHGNGNGAAADKHFYTAGECAQLAGVSTDTLRYYERRRLLPAPPRASNRYRHYPADTLIRVRVIRSALAIGFSVDELTQIFNARDRGLAPCRQVRRLAAEKLGALALRISELQHLHEVLGRTIEGWNQQLATTPSGEKAALLESLAQAEPAASKQLSPLLAPALRRKLKGQKCPIP